MKGEMFEWFFGTPSLSIPDPSRSFDFEMLTDAPPPVPSNSLEYDLDPIQELFGCTKSGIQNRLWCEYYEHMRVELNSKVSLIQGDAPPSAA
jgi:hypothetical protein